MDTVDRHNMRDFLRGFYGSAVDHWQMNEQVFNLLVRLLQSSDLCSELMDLVPRPLKPGQAAAKWIGKELRSQLLRSIRQRKEYYSVCLQRMALGMRTDFELAGRGIYH